MSLSLRIIRKKNIRKTWVWANDKNVILNSIIRKKKVTINEHTKWIKRYFSTKKNQIYIAHESKKMIGMIRIDKHKKDFIISYMIDKNYRNQGYGYEIIKKLIEKKRKFNKRIKFKALVLKKNKSSIKIFKKLQFKMKLKKTDPNIAILTLN